MKIKRTLVITLAIVLCLTAIGIGVVLGENKTIYAKASVICAQCVGIG